MRFLKHSFFSACSETLPQMNLALNDPVKHEVSNTYKQYLKENGKRVVIKVPDFYCDHHLKVLINNNITSVSVPLDPVTRATLQAIETFVQTNVESEKYKPLWLGESMLVNISKWCKLELINPDGSRQPLPGDKYLGKGTYSLVIQVSHVYIGPHKGGETYSLSLHVVELAYQPDADFDDVFDDIIRSMQTPPNPPPPTPVTAPEVKTKKQRRPRRRAGLDEVDAPQKCANM